MVSTVSTTSQLLPGGRGGGEAAAPAEVRLEPTDDYDGGVSAGELRVRAEAKLHPDSATGLRTGK